MPVQQTGLGFVQLCTAGRLGVPWILLVARFLHWFNGQVSANQDRYEEDVMQTRNVVCRVLTVTMLMALLLGNVPATAAFVPRRAATSSGNTTLADDEPRIVDTRIAQTIAYGNEVPPKSCTAWS